MSVVGRVPCFRDILYVLSWCNTSFEHAFATEGRPLGTYDSTAMVVTWHAGPPTWAPRAMPPRCCGYGWRWCDSCPPASCPTASSSNPAGIAQERFNTSPHWTGNIAKYDGRARVRSIVASPDSLPTYHTGSEAEWNLISRPLLSSRFSCCKWQDARQKALHHWWERWEECQAMSWLASWVRWSVKAVLLPLLASHLSDHGIEEHLLRGIHPVLVPFTPLPFTPLGDTGDFTTSGERKGLTWTWLLTRWGHLCWRKVCHEVQ